uniref:Coiled-coil domain containing 40 n=1 Tax=Salarias fasciatus TaxID=181472 RepID=A0A672I7H4_SALFA
MVRKRQAAFNRILLARREALDLALKEKVSKAVQSSTEETSCQMFSKQEQLARQRRRLAEQQEAKNRAQARHQQAREQLEETSGQYDQTSREHVSHLQADLDRLAQRLLSTQEVSEDLSSKLKTLHNVASKAASRRTQAEEQKLKQDFYVERLTVELERLKEQSSMYDAHISALPEETQAAKAALSEALLLARKQLAQQWNSHLLAMRRQDDALGAMQEALVLVQRETEGYRKSTAEEEERNEALTLQLRWAEADGEASRKLLAQRQAQRDAVRAHYTACLCTLEETQRESGSLRAELSERRRQAEKSERVRLELEDAVMTHLQQQLGHANAAKYSQRLKNTRNAALSRHQSKTSSLVTLIEQKQAAIASLHKKIGRIVASTAQEDLSPMHIRIHAIAAQSDELAARIQTSKQLWMKQQDALVGLNQDLEARGSNPASSEVSRTRTSRFTALPPGQIESEQQEVAAVEAKSGVLHRDRAKLCSLLSQNERLGRALQQENALMETHFIHRLKEAERESIQLQARHDRMQEDKELLLSSLLEAEQQVMLWEKKTQLVKETHAAVDADAGKEDIQTMRAEIHRMEVRLGRLVKRREQLLRDSEASVERWGSMVQRRALHPGAPHRKQRTKGALSLGVHGVHGLQRQIHDTHRQAGAAEAAGGGAARGQRHAGLQPDQSAGEQGHGEEHTHTHTHTPGPEPEPRVPPQNQALLPLLQSRVKRLQAVHSGSYRASSTGPAGEAARQKLLERLHGLSSILHRVCEEFPQYQGALRRPVRALAAHFQLQEEEEEEEEEEEGRGRSK